MIYRSIDERIKRSRTNFEFFFQVDIIFVWPEVKSRSFVNERLFEEVVIAL